MNPGGLTSYLSGSSSPAPPLTPSGAPSSGGGPSLSPSVVIFVPTAASSTTPTLSGAPIISGSRPTNPPVSPPIGGLPAGIAVTTTSLPGNPPIGGLPALTPPVPAGAALTGGSSTEVPDITVVRGDPRSSVLSFVIAHKQLSKTQTAEFFGCERFSVRSNNPLSCQFWSIEQLSYFSTIRTVRNFYLNLFYIKDFGSFLNGRSRNLWEQVLFNLKNVPSLILNKPIDPLKTGQPHKSLRAEGMQLENIIKFLGEKDFYYFINLEEEFNE